MSKTMILTATLPFEAYASYKREVEYRADDYDEEDDREYIGFDVPLSDYLAEVIEDRKEVWNALLTEAYQNPHSYDDAPIVKDISERIERLMQSVSTESIDIKCDRKTVYVTIVFKDEIDALDDNVVRELIKILADNVFSGMCHEYISYFNLEDYVDDIVECDVNMWLDEQVNPNDLQYTVEYK